MKTNRLQVCILIVIYLLLLILVFSSDVLCELIFSIALTMVLANNFSLLLGFAGLVNLGSTALLGLGTYAFYWFCTLTVHPYISLILSGLFIGIVAFLLGCVMLRLRPYLFAFGSLILASALPSFISGTNILYAAYGIYVFKELFSFYNLDFLVGLMLVINLVFSIITLRLKNSSFGYMLKAAGQNEQAALTCGINPFRYKLVAFCINSLLLGIVGGIRLFRSFSLSTSAAFSPQLGIDATLVALLGGVGTVTGPIIGSIIYQVLKDLLMRYLPGFQLLVCGILVVIIALFAPEGLVGIFVKKFRRLERILI